MIIQEQTVSKRDMSIILLFIIVIVTGLGVWFVINSLRQNPIEDALSGDRVIKTLFVLEETEASSGRSLPLASYVLMYYPPTKRAAIFDIPNNIGTIVQSRYDRIDALYNGQNIDAYERALETLLDSSIDFHIIFTLETLGKAVDLLEGVSVFIPSPVTQYETGVFFPSGSVMLDGNKAQSYLTYRLEEETDESQSLRKQRFFLSFITRLGESGTALQNKSFSQAFQTLLRSGMNRDSFVRLMLEYSGADESRMSIQSVGGNLREVAVNNSQMEMLLFPYYDGSLIKEIVREAQGSITTVGEGGMGGRIWTVEVLNGSGAAGLAGRTGELLRSFGYDVISVGNAESMDYNQTLIIDRSGQAGAANAFGGIIRCTNIRSEEVNETAPLQSYEYSSDFTLIIGKDFNGRYVN
jgi:anionic cell wall polymer biosynthesis LytR-Cps2A-Psr (LCP) family protein